MVGQLPYLTYALHHPWMSTKGYILLDWITLYHCVQSSGVKATSTKQFPVQVGGICWPTQKQGDKGLDYLSSGYYISCQVTCCQKDAKLVFCFSCCKVKQEDAQGKLKHAYPWELQVQVEEEALFFRYVYALPWLQCRYIHVGAIWPHVHELFLMSLIGSRKVQRGPSSPLVVQSRYKLVGHLINSVWWWYFM